MKRIFGFFSILSMLILLAGCATTLLMNAAVGGDVNAVKKLLNEGADVNVQGFNGWTALSEAAYGGHTKIVKLLIEKGADVNAESNKGHTALKYAFLNTQIEELLRNAGAKK